MPDKDTWADHAKDLMEERDELLQEVHRLEADRDRWRSAAGIMYEQVFQLKKLGQIQHHRVDEAMWAYNKAYNEG